MSDIPRHITTSPPKALTAIRAVLELHKPLGSPPDCTGCGDIWPCETVEAIEGAISND